MKVLSSFFHLNFAASKIENEIQFRLLTIFHFSVHTTGKQTTREVGLKSHASCIDVIMFGFKVIFKVAHLKENIVILLENKTKSL